MPHVISQTPRMPQSGHPSGLPTDRNISLSVNRVIVHTQNLEVSSPEHIAQMLENPSIRRLLSNTEFLQKFISEHPDIQQLMQQSPEVSHLLNNSEILLQTLELARNLAMIQEIMQIQQPAQNHEHPPNSQPYLGLQTMPGGNNTLDRSCADFNDQLLNRMQDPFERNPFIALLAGQVLDQFKSSTLSPSPSLQPESSIRVCAVFLQSPQPMEPPTGSTIIPGPILSLFPPRDRITSVPFISHLAYQPYLA
uniref:Uncharacterized protein n=1 Tax=Prolemur simus TaxID=1328070 RepID=A0A8C8YDW2_PROSS